MREAATQGSCALLWPLVIYPTRQGDLAMAPITSSDTVGMLLYSQLEQFAPKSVLSYAHTRLLASSWLHAHARLLGACRWQQPRTQELAARLVRCTGLPLPWPAVRCPAGWG